MWCSGIWRPTNILSYHDTIAVFRAGALGKLARLFVQVLQLCQRAGLVKLGHVALDGTKVKAERLEAQGDE